jgi:hypothetical protein
MSFIIERDFPTALASRCEPPAPLSVVQMFALVGWPNCIGRWALGIGRQGREAHQPHDPGYQGELTASPKTERGKETARTGCEGNGNPHFTRVTTDQTAVKINFYNSVRFTVRF